MGLAGAQGSKLLVVMEQQEVQEWQGSTSSALGVHNLWGMARVLGLWVMIYPNNPHAYSSASEKFNALQVGDQQYDDNARSSLHLEPLDVADGQ
ncbi:hypothetical protein H257_11193 [Aphanomyces astaci]|uniref:Uncharacterized protein n=1 Tax=Aphanomyces astaci TaxID=112090 RepID=W4G5E3_APHAT|nr:hypothetical protein H257_11193 [Aphanomyces astaci]ETV74259.1 hypothetical protein H257_11193 [Aphanomyces astaci]|eukprot:XP_009836365.1 hypothetical protein H257_11193 [Aphanomyces astaci]